MRCPVALVTYTINAVLFCSQLFGHLVSLIRISEIALLPNNARSIAVLLQIRHGLLGMFLGIAQDDDFGGVMLEQMNDNSISDASASASNNTNLHIFIRVAW